MLTGGSKGQQQGNENDSSGFGSFTRGNVPLLVISTKTKHDIRILPGFDMSLSLEDESFDKSYIPYRDPDGEMDEDTKTEGFTDWFYPVYGYTYFGEQQRRFLSALTGHKYYPAGKDPIRDCWKYIDANVNDPAIKAVAMGKTFIDPATGKEVKKEGYLKKTPRTFHLLNALAFNEDHDEWENKIVVCTDLAMRDLKKMLSIETGRKDMVISEDWDQYKYGDIAHPTEGCVIRCKEKNIERWTSCGFFLEVDPKNAKTNGLKPMKVTEEQLRGRYRIFDTNNVTNLGSEAEQYQYILDILLEEAIVPFDIIKAACEKYGKVEYNPAFDAQKHLTYFESGASSSEPPEPRKASIPAGSSSQVLDEDEHNDAFSTKNRTSDKPAKNSPGEEKVDEESPASPLSADEKDEYKELLKLISSGGNSTPEQLQRFSELTVRNEQ